MPVIELTDRFCQRTKAGAKRVDYYDTKTTGLSLRIAPTGVKSFAIVYGPEQKRSRLTLGRYPRLSLARARRMAVETLARVAEGEDPRHGGAITVSDLAGEYLTKKVKPALRSWRAIERRLNKNVLPVVGNVALADLHKRDVRRVLEPIHRRGRDVEAARVFEDVRAMVRWGTGEGYFDFNPLEGMRKPAGRPPRDRVLSDDEIAHLWHVLPEALPRSQTVQDVIQLCLLTGQRSGEVAGVTGDEIDAKKRSWTIPGSRSKNGVSNTIPLTDDAFELAKRLAVGPKLSSHAVAHTIRLAQDRFGLAQWTAHDLRRTVVSRMAELGVSPIVLAHIINHVSVTRAGVTLSVYQTYDYGKERREALELWAERLRAIVAGADSSVIPLHRPQ
jgi:integrase